jgi:hypothetical protein
MIVWCSVDRRFCQSAADAEARRLNCYLNCYEEEHAMSLTVCPAAVIAAPVEVVWGNLAQWERYSEWFSADVQVERSEPEGPATVGQTIYFAGKTFVRTLHFIFKVEEVNPERHQLGLHAFFPLGLQMKPHISCTPIDATTCRVQYG